MTLYCPRCKYEWTNRTLNPKACPRCKTYLDRPELEPIEYRHKCDRCEHEWTSNRKNPKTCPICKNRPGSTQLYYKAGELPMTREELVDSLKAKAPPPIRTEDEIDTIVLAMIEEQGGYIQTSDLYKLGRETKQLNRPDIFHSWQRLCQWKLLTRSAEGDTLEISSQ